MHHASFSFAETHVG